MRRCIFAAIVMIAFAFTGCAEDETTDTGPMDARTFTGDSQTDGGLNGDGSTGGETEEHLRLSYVKQVTPREAGQQPSLDLVVYDFEDDEEINLTSGQGEDGVDCRTKPVPPEFKHDLGWLDRPRRGA